MTGTRPLDSAWRHDHPLSGVGSAGGKEERGRVLIVGGSRLVPAALALTFEAALRVGAGKARIATVAGVAIPLGVTLPEAGMIALPEDDAGEIDAGAVAALESSLDGCGSIVLGCGAAARPHTGAMVVRLIGLMAAGSAAVIDAGAMTALKGHDAVVRASGRRLIMTPHHGELAALTGDDKDAIDRDPAAAAARAADRFGAIIVLKDRTSYIAAPGGDVLAFTNEAEGLGTAGSGDVLAGIIGGLLSHTDDPLRAAAWGVWLHSKAGEAAAMRIGRIGYLARDLLIHLPAILGSLPDRGTA